MFSSIFSTSAPVDPTAPTLHPVTNGLAPSELFGQLEPQDTEWLATSSGFITETQIFYTFLEDGSSLMCQVIHSSVGVWYPTVQFTFKLFNPRTKTKVWNSLNVSNFAPSATDKRSCKADQFSITHTTSADSAYPEGYKVSANLAEDLQVSLEVRRPAGAAGFKVGAGPKGGYTFFGSSTDITKADGYVIHRFWPRYTATGVVVSKGQAISVQDRPGMFVHAIQGMRPNLVASRWNFAHFQSEKEPGVAAVQMEYTTQLEYGGKGNGSGGVRVNLGGVVIGDKLVTVSAETLWPGETPDEKAEVKSRAVHLNPVKDADTGYNMPTGLAFQWTAPSVVADAPGVVSATLEIDVGPPTPDTERVDVLAEIPYVLKAMVNYVAGAKPYIYQFVNAAKLVITGPEAIVPGGELEVEGVVYTEATFVSV